MQEPVSASTSTSTVGSTTTTILPSTIATITIPSTIVYSVITITLTATPTLPPPSTITTVTIATTTVTSTSTSTSTYTPPLPSVSTVTYTPPTPSTSTLSATSTLTLHLLSSPTTTITRTVPATAASNQESAFVGVESGGVAGSVSATPGPTGMITGIGAAAPPELTTSRFTDTGFSRGPPLTTAPGLRSNSVGGVISQASGQLSPGSVFLAIGPYCPSYQLPSCNPPATVTNGPHLLASSSSATPPPQSSASSTGPQSEIVGCINANNPRCVNAKITLRDLLERTLTTTSYTAITAVETAYSTLPYSFTTITMSASPDPEVAANQIVVSTSTSTMTTTATVTTVTIVTYTPPTASIMTVTAREVASTAMLQPPSRVRNRFKQGPQL